MVFCEGLKLVEELLASQWRTVAVYCTRELFDTARSLVGSSQNKAIPIRVLSGPVMEYCSDLSTPPGILALAKPHGMFEVGGKQGIARLTLVIHNVQLPQNVGALLRTAEAAGSSDVYLTGASADPWGPKALRGASGSAFRMPMRKFPTLLDALNDLKATEVQSVGATMEARTDYDKIDWTRPIALVMGSEGSGFSDKELSLFDNSIRIPMKGRVESLNVGSAAAVCLFEAARQRRHESKK